MLLSYFLLSCDLDFDLELSFLGSLYIISVFYLHTKFYETDERKLGKALLEHIFFKKLVIQIILLLMFKNNIGVTPELIALLFSINMSYIIIILDKYSGSLHPLIEKSEAIYRTFNSHAISFWNYLSK